MNDNERLEAVIKHTKLSTRKFAIDLGYSAESLYLVLRGTDPLNEKIIMRIISRYPEVNRDWLLTGEGEMLLHNTNNQTNNTMLVEERLRRNEAEIEDIKSRLRLIGNTINSLTKVLDIISDDIKTVRDEQKKRQTG